MEKGEDTVSFMSDREEWIAFCCVPSKKVAHELGLVILATKNHYRVIPLDNRNYLLEIHGRRLQDVAQQVSLYCEETRRNARKRSSGFRTREYPVSYVPFLLVMASLCGVYTLGNQESGRWLYELGRMDTFAIWHHGEFWRVLTPLFLHADIGHLAGNLGFGGLFTWFVVRRWGNLSGWWKILVSGVLGNTMLAVTYFSTPHLSIGASTAVMGAIGLLAGASAKERLAKSDMGIGWLGPVGVSLFAAFALFALLGTGGERTDVGAHFWGWGCGILIGYQSVRTRRL